MASFPTEEDIASCPIAPPPVLPCAGMRSAPLRFLQCSTHAGPGGAAAVARRLHSAALERGHDAWLAVGGLPTGEPGVVSLSEATSGRGWASWCGGIARRCDRLSSAATPQLSAALQRAARGARLAGRPSSIVSGLLGREDFDHPSSRRLFELIGGVPDVVHCHNLHGGYFDLHLLAEWTGRVPILLTLHDSWLLTGHCAHGMGCERWRSGCGQCPDLTIYPPIRLDATAYNWRRKRSIYARSRFAIASPSRWLLDMAEASMLAPSIIDARVIPNGVDLTVFRPGDRLAARTRLGIPAAAQVLLMSGENVRKNPFKDFTTLRRSLTAVNAPGEPRRTILVALGDEHPPEREGGVEIRTVPFTTDRAVVADYCRAADVYVHAARAESFPTAILEALAVGTPVVASDVGGIPEVVRPVSDGGARPAELSPNGLLVPPGDPAALGAAVARLLTDRELRERLGRNAADDAARRFDVRRQVETYMAWYSELAEARPVTMS